MVRGNPAVCRKADCSQYDVGLVFKKISSYLDQDKLKFIDNDVWKPSELFYLLSSVECSSSNRHCCMELAEKISLASILLTV